MTLMNIFMDNTKSNEKINILGMTLEDLETFLVNLGEKKFRAKQIFSWLYHGGVGFDEMTNLSKDLRERLKASAEIKLPSVLQIQHSKKDGTRKYLFGLADGSAVETVFMKYKFGNSICVSSQAGCRMGCSFCASGIGGLKRNLTAGEITGQILAAEKDTGEKISNVVVMGTGEPFDNYENLSRFLQLIHHKDGMNMGYRSITVSTCGIIPKMEQFSADFPQVNLAISLHGPNDQVRSSIMPVNKKWSVDQLLSCCREYTKQTGRRITFEYALIEGVNDSLDHGEELADRLSGMLCHVNLIPLNKVEEKSMKGTERNRAEKFKNILEGRRLPVTIRREMGADIDAACGQLRMRKDVEI